MGWVPAAQISPDGRFVFVSYGWRFDRLPLAAADMLLFSARDFIDGGPEIPGDDAARNRFLTETGRGATVMGSGGPFGVQDGTSRS